ncbi:MAG: DUF4157 domain-containing protein, partial [Chitinophagaceae bacterium]|nr:DUF4157 domain-containing protein [Chitinophagaceae bacterium]
MKAAKPSTPAPAAKQRSPFFHKNDGQDFFHGSENQQSFFADNKSGAFVQAKLNVGKPNDPYEQEADAIADKVVERLSGNEGAHTKENQTPGDGLATVQTKPLSQSITPFVQTKCASCEAEEEKKLQPKADGDGAERSPVLEDPEEKRIQKKESAIQACAACEAKEKEEEKLQRKPVFESEEETVQTCSCEEEPVQTKPDGISIQTKGGNPSSDSGQIESQLDQSKGAGSPLPSGIREGMETAFGADFSAVKIHTGSSAAQMSTGLRAHAFAHGSDIYFNSNQYSPGTRQGQKLLAHELTHTIQQGTSSPVVNRSATVQREVDCNATEESPAPAAAEEASTTADHAPCAVTNPPGETPPEGTEEPHEE